MRYKFNKMTKLLIFWTCLASLFLVFAFLIKYEIKPRQKKVSIEVDMKNKINICLPEEEVETLN